MLNKKSIQAKKWLYEKMIISSLDNLNEKLPELLRKLEQHYDYENQEVNDITEVLESIKTLEFNFAKYTVVNSILRGYKDIGNEKA